MNVRVNITKKKLLIVAGSVLMFFLFFAIKDTTKDNDEIIVSTNPDTLFLQQGEQGSFSLIVENNSNKSLNAIVKVLVPKDLAGDDYEKYSIFFYEITWLHPGNKEMIPPINLIASHRLKKGRNLQIMIKVILSLETGNFKKILLPVKIK